jgi:hypothetical protein
MIMIVNHFSYLEIQHNRDVGRWQRLEVLSACVLSRCIFLPALLILAWKCHEDAATISRGADGYEHYVTEGDLYCPSCLPNTRIFSCVKFYLSACALDDKCETYNGPEGHDTQRVCGRRRPVEIEVSALLRPSREIREHGTEGSRCWSVEI